MVCKRLVVVFPLLLLWGISPACAVDGPFVGVDLGYSGPTNDNYKAHVQEGATGNPQYLVKHGIPSTRITTEGFGESHPVASNDTADGRAQNRRVELRVR